MPTSSQHTRYFSIPWTINTVTSQLHYLLQLTKYFFIKRSVQKRRLHSSFNTIRLLTMSQYVHRQKITYLKYPKALPQWDYLRFRLPGQLNILELLNLVCPRHSQTLPQSLTILPIKEPLPWSKDIMGSPVNKDTNGEVTLNTAAQKILLQGT